jgi:hypothetical protein
MKLKTIDILSFPVATTSVCPPTDRNESGLSGDRPRRGGKSLSLLGRGLERNTLAFSLLLLAFSLTAQDKPKVFFDGLGRALVTHDELNGNVLKNDTATPNRGTDGYALFDMGVNLQPYDYLRGKAIVRLKNKFGSFYGQGASVEFRQLLIEGIIAKKVKYALGDIDVEMTPYTVFNSVDSSNAYESDLFKTRRDIVHYENFNVGNNWRVQGAKATAVLLLNKKGSAKIKFNSFGTRTRPTNYNSLADRFLCGGSVNGFFGKGINIWLNYVRFFELQNQLKNQQTSYSNDVITSNLSWEMDTKKVLFRVKGELGSSYFQKSISKDTSTSNNDFFFDLKAEAEIKPLGIRFFGGYKEVGPQFSSPSAQTLRVNADLAPGLFPNISNNLVIRQQLLFDRTTQENLYNQTIQPVLMSYLPQFGNALPYGDATPNRTGFNVGLNAGGKDKLVNASLRADFMSEIIGEGTPSLRKYILLRGGATLNLQKLLSSEKLLVFSTGGRFETTNRQAPATVSLQTQQLDAGITAETMKNLDVMIGYKSLASNGNEFLAIRNSRNLIEDYSIVKINFMQQMGSLGVRYRFSDKTFFTIQGNYAMNENKLDEGASNYAITQYFVNYTIGF